MRESEERNSSLEALALSLIAEAEKQEERRSRERRLRRASTGAPMPAESAEHVREMLEDGANAIVAAHEHSLKLAEMRLAAMGEQLARCASALPAGRTPVRAGARSSASPPPLRSASAFPACSLYEADEDWAEPTAGGLCLDSLPLHMPSAGTHNGVTGGAFGIHGRRPAISTSPWSSNPARQTDVWWSEAATKVGDDLSAEIDDSAPPSPKCTSVAEDCTSTNTDLTMDAELPAASATPQRNIRAALPGWEGESAVDVSDSFGSPTPALDEESAATSARAIAASPRLLSSPWSRVTNALALTPRQHGSHKSAARLSMAGQQALAGALQVAIARHPILATISPDLRREVAASSMRELRVRAGAVVAAQGADCDGFAVVGSGIFDGYIAESGPMPVREYVRGDSFGDLGLVCNCKHATTVRCREPGTLWLLQRSAFHTALLSTSQRRAASACKALSRVAALSPLSDVQIALLACALQEVSLPAGAALLRRGETWDALYIVCAGTLEDRCFQANKKVRVRGLGEGRGRTIRAGEHLGEDSLPHAKLTNRDRRASAAGVSVPSETCRVDRTALPSRDAHASPGPSAQAETPHGLLPSVAVSAGESGCRLLRLPAAAIVEALDSTPRLGVMDDLRSANLAQREIESHATEIISRLAQAEPAIAQAFTSAGQREQLLSVLEVIRPAPGSELQRSGELSDGVLLLEAGTLLKGTPWGAAPSRRTKPLSSASTMGVGGVCGAGIVGVRRGSCLSTPERVDPPTSSHAGDEEEDAPVQPGACIGTLGTTVSSTSLFAHVGVVAYRLPRRAAMVILATTHELIKGKLTPRATPYHLRRPSPPTPPFASLSVVALLGEGGSARVLLVRKIAKGDDHNSPGRNARTPASAEFALKVQHRAHEQEESARRAGNGGAYALSNAAQASRERVALATCNHQFIPRLEAGIDGFLMMEVVRGCELFYLLREVHRFEAPTAAFYAAMVLSALVHMHSLLLVHRDIKPENLVLDAEGYLRIVDLGHSRQLAHPAERAYTLCGTPEYTAPEVLRGSGHGKEVDSWAMGVLIFELLAGYPAFCADEPIKVFSLILQGKPAVPKSFGQTARDLLRELLREQPHARLGAMRGGIVEVACHSFFAGIDWVALLGRQIEAPCARRMSQPEPRTFSPADFVCAPQVDADHRRAVHRTRRAQALAGRAARRRIVE